MSDQEQEQEQGTQDAGVTQEAGTVEGDQIGEQVVVDPGAADADTTADADSTDADSTSTDTGDAPGGE